MRTVKLVSGLPDACSHISNRYVQREIQLAMNELLGIEHDKAASNIPPPPQDEFNLYKDNRTGPGPCIRPMVPDWDNLKYGWNY
jgi:uncharacterized protein involved in high-affinity Fe2+ transport